MIPNEELNNMIEEMKSHLCYNRRIHNSDNPAARLVGFHCSGCDKMWRMKVSILKQTTVHRDIIKTTGSRMYFVKQLNEELIFGWKDMEI